MIIGFTGPRSGINSTQIEIFADLFRHLDGHAMVHGGAQGADEQADTVAAGLIDPWNIEIFPGNEDRQRYWQCKMPRRQVHQWIAPLDRNRLVANACHVLIAAPRTASEEARSGTWTTVRYARRMRIRHVLVWPDGDVVSRNFTLVGFSPTGKRPKEES